MSFNKTEFLLNITVKNDRGDGPGHQETFKEERVLKRCGLTQDIKLFKSLTK